MAQLQQVQLVNSTSAQATNYSVSMLMVETKEIRETLAQTQQHIEIFTGAPAGSPPTTPPTWLHMQAPPHSHIPPPPPACTPIPTAPTPYPPFPPNIYQPTPHTAYGRVVRQRHTGG